MLPSSPWQPVDRPSATAAGHIPDRSAGPPIIELDLSAPWEPPQERGGATIPGRRLLAAAAVVVAVMATTASGAAARPLDPVLRLPGGVSRLISGPGLVLAFTRSPDGGSSLRAHRGPDFAPVWEVPVTGDDAWALGDTIVVRERSDNDAPAVVLDAATGQELWLADADPLGVVDDLVVLTSRSDGERTVQGRERRTGQVRWSAPVAAGAIVEPIDRTPDGALSSVLEIDADGRSRVRDTATGAVRSSMVLQRPGRPISVEVLGDLVAISGDQLTARGVPSTAFRLADGQVMWRRIARPTNALRRCGRWLCESGPRGTALIEPETGVMRWRLPNWEGWFSVVDDRTVAITEGPRDWPAGRPGQPGEQPIMSILDLPTGQILHQLPGWQPVADVLPDGTQLVGQSGGDGQGRIGQLDLVTGRVSLIGTIGTGAGRTRTDVRCVRTDGHAACRSWTEMAVWRLPGAVGA